MDEEDVTWSHVSGAHRRPTGTRRAKAGTETAEARRVTPAGTAAESAAESTAPGTAKSSGTSAACGTAKSSGTSAACAKSSLGSCSRRSAAVLVILKEDLFIVRDVTKLRVLLFFSTFGVTLTSGRNEPNFRIQEVEICTQKSFE